MRIWDRIAPSRLCKNHLLAEHRETLCVYSVITKGKKGYSKHPETIRFKDNLNALVYRHRKIVQEATSRGYNFKSLPDSECILAFDIMPAPWDDQEESLRRKQCNCKK